MEGKLQLRKPENWQDFERLCKVLWGEIWECPDTIKRNGRQGQAQKGVDVYGIKKGECVYRGIQCKGKDDYTNSQLTESEIDNEIAKALLFTPKLKSFYFATTANKDADVLIKGEKEYTIRPEYFRIEKTYTLKPKPQGLFSYGSLQYITPPPLASDFFHSKYKHDYRWCTIPISITNTGKTVIENYKLEVIIEWDKVDEISDKFHYLNNIMMNQAAVARINASREARREVFHSTEYCDVIEYRPKDPILVQSDHRAFEIAIKPKDNVQSIKIMWVLYSRNYKKEGELILNVEPKFEDKKEKVEVDNIDELKENEVIILPKIVEE